MKKIIVLFMIMIASAAYSQSSEEILKYISIIESDPLSEDAKVAYSKVIEFATKSDEVHVDINADVCPWLKYKDLETKWSSYLLASFIAGNVKPQLLTKTKNDRSYPGVLLALNTYKMIKKTDKKFIIKEMEFFIKLLKQDKLNDYIKSKGKSK